MTDDDLMALQTLLTLMRPNTMEGLIWVQIVWRKDCISAKSSKIVSP